MTYHRKKLLCATAFCLAGLLGGAHAQAASDETVSVDAERKFQTVTVTAQRRDEAITDVPLAITAKSGDQLLEAGVLASTDLAGVVPNLQVNSAFGTTQPNFSLRGISVANEYNANQASPIGVYTDDAYLASRTSHGMQIFDLERVEVLRGPQGTLYGRNTTGGAINFISRFPSLSGSNGTITVGAGSHGLKEASGAFETTFSEDVLGARLAVNYRENDGLIDNLFPGGKDASGIDSLAGRLTVRARPTDRLDLRFKVYAGEDNGAASAVHNIGVGVPGDLIAHPNILTPDPDDALYSRSGLGFFEVEQDNIGKNATKSSGVYLRADYDLTDAWRLTYLGSYDKGEQSLLQDSDGMPIDLLKILWGGEFEQYNQELRVAYAGATLDFQAGVYLGEDEAKIENVFDFFFLIGADCPDPAALAGCTITQRYTQTRKSAAVFAQGDWELQPSWKLTLGVRYTDDENEYEDGQAFIGTQAGGFLIPTIPAIEFDGDGNITYFPSPEDTLPTLSRGDSAATGRVALTKEFADSLAYISYSRGYRAGAFNGGGYLDPSQVDYVKPETIDAYEIGAKGEVLNGRARYSSALFYYKYKNQQVQEVVGPVAFLRNGGGATVLGFEAELEAFITDTLIFNGSIGLLDTEYDELVLSGVDLSGNKLPFAADVTAQAGFDWEAFEVSGGTVSFNGNVAYTSDVWFSPFNGLNGNQRLKQDGNTKVNLAASYKNGPWTARAWGKNVFNEKTYGYGLDLRSAFGYDFMVPSTPATYGVSLGYEF